MIENPIKSQEYIKINKRREEQELKTNSKLSELSMGSSAFQVCKITYKICIFKFYICVVEVVGQKLPCPNLVGLKFLCTTMLAMQAENYSPSTFSR